MDGVATEGRTAFPHAQPALAAVATAAMEEQKGEVKIEEEAEGPVAPPPAPAVSAPQLNALLPARAARPLDPPEFEVGVLRRLALADRAGGQRVKYDVLTSEMSGFTCIFVRSLKEAIYGEVWDALEVELIEVNGQPQQFNVLRDANGCDRRLAVKRMRWDVINLLRGRSKEDPLQEIAALNIMADPGHPHVLCKVAAISDGTTAYLITPFVDGGELFDWIADRGGAPEHTVRSIFQQLVAGMKYMHEKGICHADMSLENCLVDLARKNTFIIDFGMCFEIPRDEQGRRYMSKADGRKAKPSYRCPETNKCKAYDGVKVDVFAAGAMLFMMLTGFPPFTCATRADEAFRQLVWSGDVEGLLEKYDVPPIDAQAADLLRRMMAYRAEDRLLPEQVLAHAWMTAPPDG